MENEMFEMNEKASDFIEKLRREYCESTGKELPIDKVIQIAIVALRERSEKCGIKVLVKAVEKSGVLNRE